MSSAGTGTIVKTRAAAALLFLLAASSFCSAESLFTSPKHVSKVKAELISENASIQPGTTFWLGVRLTMSDGWHTYWKNPGDSGLPPKIQWTLPPGLKAGEILWPAPHRIESPPLVSYGYLGQADLLIPIFADASTRPGSVTIKARIDWLECKDICVPGSSSVELSLPVLKNAPTLKPDTIRSFAEARSLLPIENPGWDMSAESNGKEIVISAAPPSWNKGDLPPFIFFPDESPTIEDSAPQIFSRAGNGAKLRLKISPDRAEPLKEIAGVLVSEEGWRGPSSEKAIFVRLPIEPKRAAPASGVWTAVFFSFLGGILLNLMPCVLPVLGIKVLGLVNRADGSRKESILHGLSYGAGVVASFWVLAGMLLTLRAAGQELGWGFQLQSSWFVIAMALLFLALSLNMFGAFEFGSFLTGSADSAAGILNFKGSFLSGVLATAVATPCTAPFMGAALGFALTQTPAVSMSIFTSLGIGMAFPYVLLTAFPALLRWMPKPGTWMIVLKKVLGIPLLATAFWLGWVFVSQTDILSPAGNSAIPWEPFSQQRLEELRKEGAPVFIDFSAEWCLSCKVNERIALDSERTAALFKSLGIVPLKADWTSRNPQITKALQSYGRSGVPAYVYYPKGAGSDPVLLPEVLTPGIVSDFLERNSR